MWKHDEPLTPLGIRRLKTNVFFKLWIYLLFTEPGISGAPRTDCVVVRFRWVKSRPCFEREVHLISSLVSSQIPWTIAFGSEGFLEHIVWIVVFVYVTLLIWFGRYPEVELKKLIVLAFVYLSQRVFVVSIEQLTIKASFLKGYRKYCDSKSLFNECNWYWCQFSSVGHFHLCAIQTWSLNIFQHLSVKIVFVLLSLSWYGQSGLKMFCWARQNNFKLARRV